MILFTTMVPAVLIPLVGLAIDASKLYIVQAKLSSAVDGAALGAGRLLGTDANTTEIAGEFLNANFPTGFWGTTSFTPNIQFTKSFIMNQITVSATVEVPLLFSRIFGQSQSLVAASAVATRKETRVELVLDRSGSMAGEEASLQALAQQFVASFISGYDELGLVVFGSSAVVGYPTGRPYNSSPTSAGGPDSNFETEQTGGDMVDMINDLKAGGDTNTAEALSLAYIELQKANNRDQDPTRLNAIVLFTDGVPTSFSAYLNDPSNNSLKSTSKCTYNPATAGTASTQMIGWIGNFNPDASRMSDMFGSGLYRMASSPNDSNTTAYWMGNATADLNVIDPKTPISGCKYLQASENSDDLDDLAQIPPNDAYGNSTSDGTAYQYSVLYNTFKTAYNSTQPTQGYQIGLASWNAVDNAAQKILADTNLNVTIYTIGYTGDGGVDTNLLNRVANTVSSSNYNAAWQTGQYISAADTNGLAVAFQTVASAILRLAQ
jgi:Flp pilus assembly protein TadG